MKLNIPENIQAIVPYPPGKPMDELEREYGVKNPIKLASNENPWGPSPKAIEALLAACSNLNRYPDGSSYYLVEAIAKNQKVRPAEVVVGNGSNELIEFLVKAFVMPGDEVITSHPSFLMYQKFVQVRGGENIVIDLKGLHHDLEGIQAAITPKTRLVFLDNPNNPTGTYLAPEVLTSFLERVPEQVIVVLDEAYVDFMDDELRPDFHALLERDEAKCPVVFLRTFSKAYGLSGLRVGFGLMNQEIAQCLHKVRQPFNLNSLGQVAAQAAIEDDDFFAATISRTRQGRQFLVDEVEKLGCSCVPSQTNFIFIDIKGEADPLYEAMLHKGVIIRSMRAYGFPTYIRITVGTVEENDRFLNTFSECLKELKYV
ncbi:histidinol-phosphate transaminase [Desulfosediminicola sp.]|uniref:histidinol-phosphate transaminase n=1 Tax=Desulfosediminicola sp. TaxID=2886825 RepID=UPI003AF1EC15